MAQKAASGQRGETPMKPLAKRSLSSAAWLAGLALLTAWACTATTSVAPAPASKAAEAIAPNPPNVLDSYVAKPDPSFAWKVDHTFTGRAIMVRFLISPRRLGTSKLIQISRSGSTGWSSPSPTSWRAKKPSSISMAAQTAAPAPKARATTSPPSPSIPIQSSPNWARCQISRSIFPMRRAWPTQKTT